MSIHSMKGGVKCLPNLAPMRITEHQGRNALVQGSTNRRNKKNNFIIYIIISA